jgi:NAD(P)-dependent dehydrogenase (short-subunit alcohol dehydrogenase family)
VSRSGLVTFTDRIAIVTGGGSGIGRAVCAELVRRRATVVVADLDQDKAEKTVAQITEEGGRATSAAVDVSVEDQVQHLLDATVSRYGRLDYLFNNAGIAIAGDVRDLTLEHWEKVFAVNWRGVLYGTRAAYAQMAKQGFGHIVNISSIFGLLPYPFNAPYCASKHAVVGLSLALRYEGADLGVRVSVVCPGYVMTEILTSFQVLNVPDEKRDRLRLPQGINPEKAAQHILDGVEANRGLIAFPALDRWIWRLLCLLPVLIRPMASRRVREFRCLRDEALQLDASPTQEKVDAET